MRQIFLLVLLFVVGQWFVKTLRRAQQMQARSGADPRGAGQGAGGASAANGASSASGSSRASAKNALPEPMVRCAECGVHAPRSESVSAGARSFCSAEHALAYDARNVGQDRPAR